MYPIYCSDKCLKYILDAQKKKAKDKNKECSSKIINNQPTKIKVKKINNIDLSIEEENIKIIEKNEKNEPKVWFNLSSFKKYIY